MPKTPSAKRSKIHMTTGVRGMLRKSFGVTAAKRPKVHVTTGGRLYVDAEELLRSKEAQRVLDKMERISMAETSSGKSSETDHGKTRG